METKNLYIVGDIHGELSTLVFNLTQRYKIKNANVIVAGDFGVGFGKDEYEKQLYNKVKERLDKNNINIYAVRGNHDNPKYFDGKHDFERLHYLVDYEITEISGKTILPIGGAISIDRDIRIKTNENWEKYNSDKRCWWKNEDVERVNITTLPTKVDIIITHEAPLTFEPIIIKQPSMDLELYEDILASRQYLNRILEEVNFNWWFYGHYHSSYSGHIGEKMYRCLNIMEIVEVS